MTGNPQHLAAVVTAYRPPSDLMTRLTRLLGVCRSIVIVDNTPGGATFGPLPVGIVLLQDGRNKGLGHALNLGIEAARRCEATTVLLLDQDSTIDASLVRGLLQSLDNATLRNGDRTCVSPKHVDDSLHLAADARPSPATELTTVSCLPTSGMTFSLAAYSPTDGFAEDLFLDYVDFEWCWRLAERGWLFFRDENIVMRHRLGTERKLFLGIPYFVPQPYRGYYQVRDILRLCTRSYVPLYSKLRLCGVLPLKALFQPLLLDRGLERLQWMGRGLLDAVRGVRGIGAADRMIGPRKGA